MHENHPSSDFNVFLSWGKPCAGILLSKFGVFITGLGYFDPLPVHHCISQIVDAATNANLIAQVPRSRIWSGPLDCVRQTSQGVACKVDFQSQGEGGDLYIGQLE